MKEIKTEDAVGAVLCHDMTEIIPGKFKGAAFKKGHIIQEGDIEHLLRMGKEHIFVYDLEDGYVHENDAARRMADAAVGDGIVPSEISEGKISLCAAYDGLLKINKDALFELNSIDDICFATVRGNRFLKQGALLGGMRVIPLVVKEENLASLEKICRKNYPVIEVKRLNQASVGIVITGNEVLKGRIEDKFGAAVTKKVNELGAIVMGKTLTGDDSERIQTAIFDFIAKGADMVCVTGGMSVDPDDRTPAAIRACGGEVITYGTPVLPGAMFMLSYVNGIPVVGLPGCVMYARRTVFDLVLPRLLLGEKLDKKDFVSLGYGGQCKNCKVCTFPDCGFGG